MKNISEILLIGPCANKKDITNTGGIIILFEDLLYQMRKSNISFMLVDTNKKNYPNIFFAMVSIYLKIIIKSFYVKQVSIHGTAKDYLYIAPFTIFFANLINKNVSTRKFAGNFNSYYKSINNFKKKIIKYVLKNSNYNFFETKYLVEFFKEYNSKTFWFPNVRRFSGNKNSKEFKKKFVFISQLYKSKGVDELLRASNELPVNYTIDLFGPLQDDYTIGYFDGYKASYKGALSPNKVLQTLDQYDVLILATYYPGEGYPGIIIEALSLGKPLIVTGLDSIKEMVTSDCAIFVKPKCSDSIVDAVKIFNKDNYNRYSIAAFNSFDKFNSDTQTRKFLNVINN